MCKMSADQARICGGPTKGKCRCGECDCIRKLWYYYHVILKPKFVKLFSCFKHFLTPFPVDVSRFPSWNIHLKWISSDAASTKLESKNTKNISAPNYGPYCQCNNEAERHCDCSGNGQCECPEGATRSVCVCDEGWEGNVALLGNFSFEKWIVKIVEVCMDTLGGLSVSKYPHVWTVDTHDWSYVLLFCLNFFRRLALVMTFTVQ